ncbi:hypothetical protein M2440_000558 [Methylorubrum extorquens]|nr:hypothetical protein [Methylorubrum extorquens]
MFTAKLGLALRGRSRALERFPTKWVPVRRKKARHNKRIEA